MKTLISAVLRKITCRNKYGSSLEQFIVKNRPQDVFDVERLQREYNHNLPFGGHYK
jgi:hypothetical protein